MIKLFEYNWQVRKDWFEWCKTISEEELLRPRVGGVGSILQTLFHIVDVEYSWIRDLQGKSEFQESFKHYQSLDRVIQLSETLHPEVKSFLLSWTTEQENCILSFPDSQEIFKHGEVLRHVIAHEIHHIGQLSVWSRELGKEPVTANLIRRGLFLDDQKDLTVQ